MGRSTPSESHAPADIDAGASVAYSRSIAMPIAIVSLVAMCTLAGCRGGNVVGIALLIAIAIAAAIRNGISQSQQKCPHYGRAGSTPTYHEKGFVDYETCDHCGKEI